MLWNTPEVKQLNSERVRREIQKTPKCTKAMVAKETSLSVATCNTIFNELLQAGEIRTCDQEEAIMGRPAIRFEYNEDFCHVLGISVTIGKQEEINYMIGNALGDVIKQDRVSHGNVDGAKILEVVQQCIEQDPLIRCVTVGIPGVAADGVIERCDVEGLVGEPLAEEVKKKTGIDTIVGNDMDITSYGIYQSTFVGQGNLCTVLFPPEGESYVGAGMIIDGKILHGASEFAGEIRYVAEAFGVTTSDMKKLRKDKEQLIDFAVKMATILIATIDPQKIVLMGEGLEAKDALKIRNGCGKIVSDRHVPKIEIDNEGDENYATGLIRLALNHISFPLSESM